MPIHTQADPGKNNSAPDLSRGRIIEGGSWKRQRIVVLVPSAKTMPAQAALAHWNLIFPPNQPVFRMLAVGMEVGEAYSTAIEQILATPELRDWEYLLTIETDNIPPPDGVVKLVKRMEAHPELSCVSGLYWTKYEMGVPQIWGDPSDPVLNYRPQPPKPGELVECCGTGMGFALWRLSMFRDQCIARPLFRTKASKEEGTGTQDLAFWSEARKWGYRCAVDCDVAVGHLDVSSGTVW